MAEQARVALIGLEGTLVRVDGALPIEITYSAKLRDLSGGIPYGCLAPQRTAVIPDQACVELAEGAVQPVPGAEDFLRELRERGYSVAVYSSLPAAVARVIVQRAGLDGSVELVLSTFDMNGPSEPKTIKTHLGYTTADATCFLNTQLVVEGGLDELIRAFGALHRDGVTFALIGSANLPPPWVHAIPSLVEYRTLLNIEGRPDDIPTGSGNLKAA